MTTQEIYTLANELTNKEVNNILAGWKNANETEQIRMFNSLVNLGDSRDLSCATTIAEKYNKKDNNKAYTEAYTN